MPYKVTIAKMVSERGWKVVDNFDYSGEFAAWGEFYEQVAKSQHRSEPVSIKLQDEYQKLATFKIK
jgi:hypothetical protein